MLQELTGYFSSIKKTQAAMKVALCEIKKNLQGTNSDRKETRTQINGLEQKEENIQPGHNEERCAHVSFAQGAALAGNKGVAKSFIPNRCPP